MNQSCGECGRTYDDVDHLTICPHDAFGMHTVVVRGDGKSRCCSSIEEASKFSAGIEEPQLCALHELVETTPLEFLQDALLAESIDARPRHHYHRGYDSTPPHTDGALVVAEADRDHPTPHLEWSLDRLYRVNGTRRDDKPGDDREYILEGFLLICRCGWRVFDEEVGAVYDEFVEHRANPS